MDLLFTLEKGYLHLYFAEKKRQTMVPVSNFQYEKKPLEKILLLQFYSCIVKTP